MNNTMLMLKLYHSTLLIFDYLDDSYWFYPQLLLDIMNEHAPLKSKRKPKFKAPFMNDELRKAMNYRKSLRTKTKKAKNTVFEHHSYQKYARQRNRVVTLQRKSVRNYLKKNVTRALPIKLFGLP